MSCVDRQVCIKVFLPRDDPTCPSVFSIWQTVRRLLLPVVASLLCLVSRLLGFSAARLLGSEL